MAPTPGAHPIIFLFLILLLTSAIVPTANPNPIPSPKPWPEQFHSVLLMNSTSTTGALSLVDLWYDWPNGRNFNIIQKQLGGPPLHDLEWDNGTSYYYTLSGSPPTCRSMHFEVGILRPDWLDGANYLGQETFDGFLCNVWEKVEFISYYEVVATRRPVHWLFHTGRSAHVMTFEVGAVLEDAKWQAPSYCFGESGEGRTEDIHQFLAADNSKGMMMQKRSLRGIMEL